MSLRPGAIRAEWVRADLGTVVVEVGDYSFPIATRGETLADRIVIFAPLRRTVSGHMNGEALAPGVLHAWGGEAEVAGASGPLQFGIMSFAPHTLDRTARAPRCRARPPGPRRVPHGACRRVAAPRGGVRHGLAICCDTQKPAERVRSVAVGDELVELAARRFAVENSRELPAPHSRLNSVSIARACEDHAARARYQGVTLADLCVAAGASERRVRHAFYECYGLSPTAYLRVAALHEVRRTLIEGPPSRDAVSRAASDFGFWHLSRFAAQYRTLFGESPSTTLDRRSQAAAS